MRQAAPVLLLAVVLAISGCTGSTPTGSGDEVSVEYVVRPGQLPDDVQSVNVSFRVVFVSTPDDLGPCYPEIFHNPHDPTPTPLSEPSGSCYAYGNGHRGGPITVTLTAATGERSLGEFTAPSTSGGHALLVTEVTVTRRDGTRVTDVWDSGFEAIASPEQPDGPYGIELDVERAPDEDYVYQVSSDRFELSSGGNASSVDGRPSSRTT